MSSYLVVADESVDFRVITHLRNAGFSVYAIAEQMRSLSDKDVLLIATTNDALLITEDKDFGELVFRMKLEHSGILLIRVLELPIADKFSLIARTIANNLEKLKGVFAVLSDNKLRIKQQELG